MSFVTLHNINDRATLEQFFKYKHSLLIHTLYNNHAPTIDWILSNFNQNFNSRETTYKSFSNHKYKVRKIKKLSNRLNCLNEEIQLDWLNKKNSKSYVKKFLPALGSCTSTKS